MATAQTLHLLAVPPLATPPAANVVISATTPTAGVMTTSLLDPAVPAAGLSQVLREFKPVSPVAGTYNYILGRFLTRLLPAQTIGAGNWTLNAAFRWNGSTGPAGTVTTGFCVAQWRPSTSAVIARFLDSMASGPAIVLTTTSYIDNTQSVVAAGGALTLAVGDCLILEVWARWVVAGTTPQPDFSLLLNGLGQYYPSNWPLNQLTDTDAVLVAPAPITFT